MPRVERRLLEPIGTAEAIEQVMSALLRDLAVVLQARGLGVRSLRLIGLRVDRSEQVIGVGSSRPPREVPHLLRLLSQPDLTRLADRIRHVGEPVQRRARSLTVAAVIAVVLAALGLFGFSIASGERRTANGERRRSASSRRWVLQIVPSWRF